MASVRMTNDLRADICRAAESAYKKANPTPKPSTEFVEMVKAAVISSSKQQYLQKCIDMAKELDINCESTIPKIDSTSEIQLTKDTVPDDRGHRRHSKEELKMRFATPITWLKAPNNSSWYSPQVDIADLPLDKQTNITEKFDGLKGRLAEHHEKERNYNYSIQDLTGQCTTLKQLLDIWPGAESLIPPDKLQKMHTKVTRKERAAQIKSDVSFDPSIANQTILTAKLMGA